MYTILSIYLYAYVQGWVGNMNTERENAGNNLQNGNCIKFCIYISVRYDVDRKNRKLLEEKYILLQIQFENH